MTYEHSPDYPDQPGAERGLLARLGDVPGRYWVALVLAILAIAFVVQNREDAEVSILFVSVTASLWLVLLISIVVGVIIGLLLRRRSDGRQGRSGRRAGAPGP